VSPPEGKGEKGADHASYNVRKKSATEESEVEYCAYPLDIGFKEKEKKKEEKRAKARRSGSTQKKEGISRCGEQGVRSFLRKKKKKERGEEGA